MEYEERNSDGTLHESLLDASIDKQLVRNHLYELLGGLPRGRISTTGLTDALGRTVVLFYIGERAAAWALLDEIRKPVPDFFPGEEDV